MTMAPSLTMPKQVKASVMLTLGVVGQVTSSIHRMKTAKDLGNTLEVQCQPKGAIHPQRLLHSQGGALRRADRSTSIASQRRMARSKHNESKCWRPSTVSPAMAKSIHAKQHCPDSQAAWQSADKGTQRFNTTSGGASPTS
ncbi:hypothetical protein K437DRAFT_89718 [Tilletiaria anomala UBC 951]|uniref:Uncharacterized protein n=1 Tax=Tilletiaria anomala (strain ATCC 24038 / CBS 436.72 / UBC 951) TaxID=1037660 RepID=A0A066V015_TILAU|nr:uncharacterized protein K437DRAFT_89718 [Tilletiaria anomala UBC 951]KDN34811.1 hypothetical protein K437DRAFT_89718 [Tilletiaria anomala UBC 951]